MANKRLAKNIAVMSVAVFLSRILGLVRDQVMAYFFGTNFLNDAFNVAYTIPNLLRRLFGEGALSTAFVPIYNEIGTKNDREKQFEFALNVLSILTLFLAVLVGIGIVFAPLIIKIIYPGLAPHTAIFAIKLTRIIFPYLFFIGLSSTMIAILNSHEYFFMTGLSSALLNLGMILTVVLPWWILKLDAEELIIWAGWGVFLGGFLQTVINLPYLRRIGYRWMLIVKFSGEHISLLWKRFIPSMIGIGIREINLIADGIMASFLPIGSITALGYGNRLMQLPLGIFAISAGTAVLPLYSRCVAEEKYEELSESLRFSSITLGYLILPITTLILALGGDFVRILFFQGEFGSQAAFMTTKALIFYSIGLIFYSLNQTMTPIFYANKDTKTPVKIAAFIVFLNICMNFILMQFMGHSGLAFSTSITAAVNYIVLMTSLKRKLPQVSYSRIWWNLGKAVLICGILYIIIVTTNQFFITETKLFLIIKDGVIALLSFMIFYLAGLILKLDYLSEARDNLWKRFRRA
ncbi:MAG TPA: murein biosynthesis integral membrane protein MurJ [Candidatus Cloacimonadota bacterium]|nr:murein biosynthesis integral membrane protein MurJ [Candidatus Cloacimonadota bacterium]